jgi:hypothetical protein
LEIGFSSGDVEGISTVVVFATVTLVIAAENSAMEKGLIKMISAPAAKNIDTSDSRAFPVIAMINDRGGGQRYRLRVYTVECGTIKADYS